MWEGLPVAEAATRARATVLDCWERGLFARNDQKYAADFILMKLGVRLQEGITYTFPDLAEPCNVRFLQRTLYCDLDLIEKLREFQVFDQEIADQALKVMDRHCDYLSPQLVPMILADKTLPSEVRQEFATVLNKKLEEGAWTGQEYEVGENESPGPNMASGDLFWMNGRPSLSSFIGNSSFLIFKVIDQQPEDLAWLRQPVSDWEASNSYFDFEYYVKNKHVVNDACERAIGVMKPLVGNFKKEDNFQAADILKVDFLRGQIFSFEILRKKKWKNITKNHLICVKNDNKKNL